MMSPKPVTVQLSNAEIAQCEDFAHRLVAHYSTGGFTGMPWSHDEMTLDQFEAWVASRQEAGRSIAIETCELGRWFVFDSDPYGFKTASGRAVYPQISKDRFVRDPDSRGWIWEGDLPKEKAKAMYARIERDRR